MAILTPLTSIVFDASPYVATLNASVSHELSTRNSVQEQLKGMREVESTASIASALAVAGSFVNSLSSSISDLIGTASVVPSVIQMTANTVKADSMLDELKEAPSVLKSLFEGAKNAVTSSWLGSILFGQNDTSIASDFLSWFGDDAIDDLFDFSDIANEISAALGGLAFWSIASWLNNYNIDEFEENLLDDGADYYVDEAIFQLGLNTEIPEEVWDTKKRAQANLAAKIAAAGLNKNASVAYVDKALSKFRNRAADLMHSNDFDPATFTLSNIRRLFGNSLASSISDAVPGVPNIMAGVTDLFTGESISRAGLLGTIQSYTTKPNVSFSVLGGLFNQAAGAATATTRQLFDSLTNSSQTVQNLRSFFNINGSGSAANDRYERDRQTGNIVTRGLQTLFGVTVPTATRGVVNTVVQMASVAEDLAHKSRQLIGVDPITRAVGNTLRSYATDVVAFNQLTNAGTNAARICLGDAIANRLSSISSFGRRRENRQQRTTNTSATRVSNNNSGSGSSSGGARSFNAQAIATIRKWKDQPSSDARSRALRSAGVDLPDDPEDVNDTLRFLEAQEKTHNAAVTSMTASMSGDGSIRASQTREARLSWGMPY